MLSSGSILTFDCSVSLTMAIRDSGAGGDAGGNNDCIGICAFDAFVLVAGFGAGCSGSSSSSELFKS